MCLGKVPSGTALKQVASGAPGPTDGDDQEANVTEPVRSLVGQLLHEEPQDGAEVTLVTCHRHLHRGRCLCVAVTATEKEDGFNLWET